MSFDPSAAETKQTIIGLPEGTYAKVQITALEQIMGFDQPKPGPSCLDYGNDYITVFEGPGIQETLGVDCPDNDMRAAQNAVLQIYYNAIKEPSE